MITASVYRCLDERWRRSALPLAVARHPTERPEVYKHALSAVATELQRRQLPPPSQIHSDWAPGLASAIREAAGQNVLHSPLHVPDMEHMIANITTKKKTTALDGSEIRVPRMKSRDVKVVPPYLHTMALLPTSGLFLVALRTFLTRIKDGWEEPAFHDYIINQYLYRASLRPAVVGESEAWAAKWWHGASGPVAAGFPPSQQTVEQSHRHFKRCITDAPGRTVIDVLESLKEVVALWTSTRSSEAKSYTLLTPTGCTAVVPTRPDGWMLRGLPLHRLRAPGGVRLLPTIKRILEARGPKPARNPKPNLYCCKKGCGYRGRSCWRIFMP